MITLCSASARHPLIFFLAFWVSTASPSLPRKLLLPQSPKSCELLLPTTHSSSVAKHFYVFFFLLRFDHIKVMESTQKEEGLSPEEKIGAEEEIKKLCSDCKTSKTPLWRSGPSGPKSLCNACGIRYRKKRPTVSAAAAATAVRNGGKKGKTRNLMPLGQEVEVVEGRRKAAKRVRSPKQWGEVETAALLLMALSCGAVFA